MIRRKFHRCPKQYQLNRYKRCDKTFSKHSHFRTARTWKHVVMKG